MTKDQAAGTDNPDRRDHVQMPVRATQRHLYPEWDTVGDVYKEGETEFIILRKHIAN